MYVSKGLALILKDRGFNECSFDSNCSTTQGLHTYIPDYEDGLYIPNEQVLDWIFNHIDSVVKQINFNHSQKEYLIKQQKVEWLQFWYTTLLEHKFGLMYEFIGRLEEWFESNNLYPISYLLTQGWQSDIHILISKELDEMEVINLSTYWDTKQQAKHEAIMKCFELLKENTNGSI